MVSLVDKEGNLITRRLTKNAEVGFKESKSLGRENVFASNRFKRID
jgi:hypothetical protein